MLKDSRLLFLFGFFSLISLLAAEERPDGWGAEWQKPGKNTLGPRGQAVEKALDEGDLPKLKKETKEWLKQSPEDPTANFIWAKILQFEGRDVEAVNVFSRLLNAGKLNQLEKVGFLYFRGNSYLNLGQYREALRDFEKLTPDSQFPGAYNNLAWIHATCPDASIRNGKKAVREAQSALKLSRVEARWQFLDTLAAAYAETGNFAAAVKTQTEAIQIAKNARMKVGMVARLRLYEKQQPFRELPKTQS